MFSSVDLSDLGLNDIISGVQVQGDKLSQEIKSFAVYPRNIAEKTKDLSGQALYSNLDYKAW